MVLILMSCCSKLTFLIEISQRGCEFCPGVGTNGRLHEKKVAVLLDFVQITLTPPLPLIWTTCTIFFERLCAKKFAKLPN